MTWWVYPTGSASVAGSFEFDQYQFKSTTGIEFMWGTQCNQVNHLWQVFNELRRRWKDTGVACSLTPNTWHKIRWDVHRVPGDTDDCAGMPCMYYDNLNVDGNEYPINLVYPAGYLPYGWSSTVGVQVQIDIGDTESNVTINEYLDLIDFVAM